MIIECPSCHAQYDLGSETSLEGRKVRCSQCHHVWQPGDEPTLAPFQPQPDKRDSPAHGGKDVPQREADSAPASATKHEASGADAAPGAGAAREGKAGALSPHGAADPDSRGEATGPAPSPDPDTDPGSYADTTAGRPPEENDDDDADWQRAVPGQEMPAGTGAFGESFEQTGRSTGFGDMPSAGAESDEPQTGRPIDPAGADAPIAWDNTPRPGAVQFDAGDIPPRDTDPGGHGESVMAHGASASGTTDPRPIPGRDYVREPSDHPPQRDGHLRDNLAERMALQFEHEAGQPEFGGRVAAPDGDSSLIPGAAGTALHEGRAHPEHQPKGFGTAIPESDEVDPFDARNRTPNGDTDMVPRDHASGPRPQGDAPQAAVNATAGAPWDEDWLQEGAGDGAPAEMAGPVVAQTRGGGRWKAAIGWLVLIIAVAGGATLALMRPNAVVAALPGTAEVYRALGQTVNIRGLRFDDVEYRWVRDQSAPALEISGSIRNITSDPVAVPIVVFVLLDSEGERVFKWAERVRRAPLPSGRASRFTARVPAPPQLVRKLRLRFAKHG